jgi:4-amino-4-deoxy-L-arabinose transferase-like glycosyltransferase
MRRKQIGAGPLQASVFVEGLRAAPAAFLGLALALHAIVWTLAQQWAEPVPPAELAVALALGREWQAGYPGAPPLGPWLAEAIYAATGSFLALRFAAALCVAAAAWLTFLFARRVAGDRHGAIAVLLLVGVYPLAFPVGPLTADAVQLPLAALAIWFWWLAAGARRPIFWAALGFVLGAMLYAGPQGLPLLAVLVLVTLSSPALRRSVLRLDGLIPAIFGLSVFAFVIAPRVIWLARDGFLSLLPGTGAGIAAAALHAPLEIWLTVLLGHFGMIFLAILATLRSEQEDAKAPVFARDPEAPDIRRAVFAIGVLPAFLLLLALAFLGTPAKITLVAALLPFGGLALVLLAGEKIAIRRQRAVAAVALVLLFLPPVVEIALGFAAGRFGLANRAANWPARAAAQTFTDIYRTRTGRPLEYLIGERSRASQIAILSRDRPRIVADGDLANSPWIGEAAFRAKGGVLFWEIEGASASPPPALLEKFPALVVEAPVRLPWARGGDPVRIGWGIVPPRP